jgi:hypothetical protein
MRLVLAAIGLALPGTLRPALRTARITPLEASRE